MRLLNLLDINNFVSNVVDATPGVGHVKGLCHYALGQVNRGNNAMYQATRTSAVIGGGAVGCLAGPGGAVAGAIAAGSATDLLVSAIKKEDVGILRGAGDVCRDIAVGRNPTASIVSTGFQIALDGVGGYGMSGVSGLAKQVLRKGGEQVVKKGAEQVVRKGAEQVASNVFLKALHRTGTEKQPHEWHEWHDWHEWDERAEEDENKPAHTGTSSASQPASSGTSSGSQPASSGTSSRSQPASSGTSSGSQQPPQGNEGNNENSNEVSQSKFLKFLEWLKKIWVIVFGELTGPFYEIFVNKIRKDQKKYLLKIINNLKKDEKSKGMLDKLLELVLRVFKDHKADDFSFENFVSLLEFVHAYIMDELEAAILVSSGSEPGEPKLTLKERQAKLIDEILTVNGLTEIVRRFDELSAEIEAETSGPNSISPDFRDIYAAVYHYFKHRCVPGDGELTVKEYYKWIRKLLEGLKKTGEYAELLNHKKTNL